MTASHRKERLRRRMKRSTLKEVISLASGTIRISIRDTIAAMARNELLVMGLTK
jgi:hypothetical protein